MNLGLWGGRGKELQLPETVNLKSYTPTSSKDATWDTSLD